MLQKFFLQQGFINDLTSGGKSYSLFSLNTNTYTLPINSKIIHHSNSASFILSKCWKHYVSWKRCFAYSFALKITAKLKLNKKVRIKWYGNVPTRIKTYHTK